MEQPAIQRLSYGATRQLSFIGLSHNLIRIRVWERGCGVTLACGTGSCASAVAGFLTGRTGRNVSVLLDGGELQIEYSENDNHVYMTGPAVEVFQGEININ